MKDSFQPLDKLHQLFPQLSRQLRGKPLIYLDNGATTLKLQSVINSEVEHYTHNVANIHRGVHTLSEEGTIHYEETRDAVAKFLNASKREEIIFTKGTTDSINLAAFSLGELLIKKGDHILISTMEHHSNIVPWQMMAERKGATVLAIPMNEDGELCLDQFHKLLTPKVKIVAVNHVSNALGTINPIKQIIKAAHQNGSVVLIDAAQSIAHAKVDVQDLDCDLLAFSAHKMFGPTGVGILYGKESLLDRMPPYQGGGDMIDEVRIEKTTYNKLPHKFEAGTPHIAGVIALRPAIEFILEQGIDSIHHYEDELTRYATTCLKGIDGLRIIGTAKEKTSILSFVIDGVHHHDLGTLLDQQGIAVRTGHHCTQPLMRHFNITGTTRASISLYTTKSDIDQLVKGINKARMLL